MIALAFLGGLAGSLHCLHHVRAAASSRSWRAPPTSRTGDGFNDAPALAAADVGIAVGQAADLTRTTADAVVRGAGVVDVPWLVRHARAVVRVARENLAWAFAYNAVAVALAAAGRLEPIVAALAMLASSVAVVANARRLRARAIAPASPAGTVAEPARGAA